LSLEALRVLEAVARHSSFSKAAAELHKVPSALSYTIAQLEQKLGVQLFDRSSRVVELTPSGREIMADGQRLLLLAIEIERRIDQRMGGSESALTIVVDTIFGAQSLHKIVTAFDVLHSETNLTLGEEALSGCWHALESGRADIVVAGIGVGGVPSGGGFQMDVIGTVHFDFAVAPSHPLVALKQPGIEITDDHIRRYRVVNIADSAPSAPLRSFGMLTGQNTLTVKTMRDKLNAHIAGLGVGFLPHFLGQPEYERGRLVKLDVLQRRLPATFCVAHRHGSLGNAGRWFLAQMTAVPSPFGSFIV
jgi:DNA-binding transcriptional LysR family regulator